MHLLRGHTDLPYNGYYGTYAWKTGCSTLTETRSKLDKHSACSHTLQELAIKILPTCERIILNFLCHDFLDM
jgi:hypothetical protein